MGASVVRELARDGHVRHGPLGEEVPDIDVDLAARGAAPDLTQWVTFETGGLIQTWHLISSEVSLRQRGNWRKQQQTHKTEEGNFHRRARQIQNVTRRALFRQLLQVTWPLRHCMTGGRQILLQTGHSSCVLASS